VKIDPRCHVTYSSANARNRARRLTELFQRVLFGLFAAQWFFVWIKLWLPQLSFSAAQWPEALLLLLATSSTLAGLLRELPWQNVLVASAIIGLVTSASQSLVTLVSAQFGRFEATGASWPFPLVWLVAILNARGVARLVLSRWRKSQIYGLWLIGLTATLVALFGFGSELFAALSGHYWFGDTHQGPRKSHGTSWLDLGCWGATALLVLLCATPSLVNKKPVEQRPLHQPMITWLLLNLLFASATYLHGLWPAAMVLSVGNGFVLLVALQRQSPKHRQGE